MRGKANSVDCPHKDIRPQNKTRTRFKCYDCEKWFSIKTLPTFYKAPVTKYPKVLIFDLETAPLWAYVFQVWNTNIGMHQLVDNYDNYWVITWSAKWLFDSKVMSSSVTPKEALENDDRRIVRGLWELINEADIIIAHNAIGFDIPMINMRFFLNDIKPPSPYQVIDTLRVVRKQFKAPHNKLDYWCKQLGIDMKNETTMALWKGCMQGNKEDLDYMLKYNKQDVFILEEFYLKLRSWIKNHPNFNLYNGNSGGCSTCGSTNLTRNGSYPTNVNRFDSFQCDDCNSFSRTGKSGKKTDLRSIAK